MATEIDKLLEGLKVASSLDQRLRAYDELDKVVRADDTPERVDRFCELLPQFRDFFLTDLKDRGDDVDHEIRGAALRALGYFIHHAMIAAKFTTEEMENILTILTQLILKSQDKLTCNLAVWCLAVQSFPADVLREHINSLVDSCCHAMTNPWQSSSCSYEGLAALKHLARHVPHSLKPFLLTIIPKVVDHLFLARTAVQAQSTLAELCAIMGPVPPSALSKELHSRAPALMDKINAMAKDNAEVQAIQGWAWITLLLGTRLFKDGLVNNMLKIPERSFSATSSATRVATFDAWLYLVDNFRQQLSGFVLPKRLALLIKPIQAGLNPKYETQDSVRWAALQSWSYIVSKAASATSYDKLFSSLYPGVISAVASIPAGTTSRVRSAFVSHIETLTDRLQASMSTQAGSAAKAASASATHKETDAKDAKDSRAESTALDAIESLTTSGDIEPLPETVRASEHFVLEEILPALLKFVADSRDDNSRLRIWTCAIRLVAHATHRVVRPTPSHVTATHSVLSLLVKLCTKPTSADADPVELLASLNGFVTTLLTELPRFILHSSLFKAERSSSLSPSSSRDGHNIYGMIPVIAIAYAWAQVYPVAVRATDAMYGGGGSTVIESYESVFDILFTSGCTETSALAVIDAFVKLFTSLFTPPSDPQQLKPAATSTSRASLPRAYLLHLWDKLAKVVEPLVEDVLKQETGRVPLSRGGSDSSGDDHSPWYALLTCPLHLLSVRAASRSTAKKKAAEDLSRIEREIVSVKRSWNQLFGTLNRCIEIRSPDSRNVAIAEIASRTLDLERSAHESAPTALFTSLTRSVVTQLVRNMDYSTTKSSRKRRHSESHAEHDTVDRRNMASALKLMAHVMTEDYQGLTKASGSKVTDASVFLTAFVSFCEGASCTEDVLQVITHAGRALTLWCSSRPAGLDDKQYSTLVHDSSQALFKGWRRSQAPFDSQTLALWAPLLAALIRHSSRRVANATVSFWNDSWGKLQHSDLTYPSELATVFASLEKSVINLPGFDASKVSASSRGSAKKLKKSDGPATLSRFESLLDDSQSGFGSSPSAGFLGRASNNRHSFMNKETPLKKKKGMGYASRPSPRSAQLQAAAAAVMRDRTEDAPVHIETPHKKQRLTEHQKEVARARGVDHVGIATYTRLDKETTSQNSNKIDESTQEADTHSSGGGGSTEQVFASPPKGRSLSRQLASVKATPTSGSRRAAAAVAAAAAAAAALAASSGSAPAKQHIAVADTPVHTNMLSPGGILKRSGSASATRSSSRKVHFHPEATPLRGSMSDPSADRISRRSPNSSRGVGSKRTLDDLFGAARNKEAAARSDGENWSRVESDALGLNPANKDSSALPTTPSSTAAGKGKSGSTPSSGRRTSARLPPSARKSPSRARQQGGDSKRGQATTKLVTPGPGSSSAADSDCMFAKLADCADPVAGVFAGFAQFKAVRQVLMARGIETVGDLASLPPSEVGSLPLPGVGNKVKFLRARLTAYYRSLSPSRMNNAPADTATAPAGTDDVEMLAAEKNELEKLYRDLPKAAKRLRELERKLGEKSDVLKGL